MFFEVFQARVDDLLHPVHFGPKQVPDIVDVPVSVGKTNVDRPCKIVPALIKIVQALIIDMDADQRGDCWEGCCGYSRHQLFLRNHSFTSLPESSFFQKIVASVHLPSGNSAKSGTTPTFTQPSRS